jgi:uncharacterized membrane protein
MTDAMRPLTLGELLDRTFSFYRRHFVLFVGVTSVANVLTLVFGLGRSLGGADAGFGWFTLVWSIAAAFISLVTAVFAHAATVVAVSEIQLGRQPSILAAFGRIRPRLGELVLLSLNVGIRVFIGLILLIIPGIVLALKYALATPVAVLEDRTVSESLPRSADLTAGHRGRIFLVYLLFFVLTMCVTMVWTVPVQLLLGPVTGGRASILAQIVAQLSGFVTNVVISPVVTIALTLVYYDERVRKEAFDLEHMMRQLDALRPGRPATA